MNSQISDTQIPCSRNCGKILELDEIENHTRYCFTRKISCKGCREPITWKVTNKHNWDQCIIDCELCGQPTTSRDLYLTHWNRMWERESWYYHDKELNIQQITRKICQDPRIRRNLICPYLPWLILLGNTERTRKEIIKLIQEEIRPEQSNPTLPRSPASIMTLIPTNIAPDSLREVLLWHTNEK